MEEFDNQPLNDDMLGILLRELDAEIAADAANASEETSLVDDSEAEETVEEETFEVMVVPFNTEENPVTAEDVIGQYSILWIPIIGLLLMHVIMRIPMMKENWKL